MVVKGLIFLLCAVVVVLAKETYSDKYDNVDMEEIIGNDKLLLGYVNCLLDKGPCTPDGKELKNTLPDALETGCEKCTETQKEKATAMIHHLVEHKQDIWNDICAKYDPEGKWRKKYEDEARAKGIEIPK